MIKNTAGMKIKIVIVDDHNVVVSGLQNMLRDHAHIQVISTYNSGSELLEGLKKQQPDVLLLDIQLPDITGDELTSTVTAQYPDIGILIMTGFDTTYHVKNLLQKGAQGYLLKNTAEATLIEAIEAVAAGSQFIDPSLREQLLQDLLKNKKQVSGKPVLSRREKDVLTLIMEEYTSQEIADKLFLSLRTVENYRINLLQKLHVKNTAGLVKVAIQMGLLE
jgi:DNA-binding NarL/FixJ family response regulator